MTAAMRGLYVSQVVTEALAELSVLRRSGLSGVLLKAADELGERMPVAQCERVRPWR